MFTERRMRRSLTGQFHIQIRPPRWVDSPEDVNLIGKIDLVGTAIVIIVTEG